MGLLDNIGKKLSSMSDDDKRGMALNLASGFAGMSGNPNTNSIMAGIEGQKAALASRREKATASDKLTAQTAQALKLISTTYPDIAQAIQGGFMSPKEGMKEVMRRRNEPEKERKIVKGADNYNYYADDQSRVLGDVTVAQIDSRTAQQKNYEYWIEKGLTDAQAQAQVKSGTNISLGEKGFLKGMGTGGSDILNIKQAQATGAVNSINTINSIRPLLESGVFAGPLAENQMMVTRLASKFGIKGGDSAEVLANTTAAMQKLANLELTAAASMKGQGQISDNERRLIKRASGGDLMAMTSGEVSMLLDGLDKLARQRIDEYGDYMGKVSEIDGAAQFMPLYEVNAPSPYTPSLPAGVTVKRIP